jgi:glutamate---cysteine ligase / carboxylate-amine ligase
VTNPGAQELEAAFDAPDALTVGAEEEVMLLDPQTLDLWPHAGEVLARLDGDPRFKPELPASQVEIVTEPAASAQQVVVALAEGRRDLAAAAHGLALPATLAVHPFAAAEGELASSERYDEVAAEYGPIARRQLVAALQVHVAVGEARRTLAVYNSLRAHLPEIAALAANAPFHEGVDTGLASIRPKIAESLPRQGMPPAIESWATFAEDLGWGERAGSVPNPSAWWWEARPNPLFGTLEVRVPDAQTTLADAAGVIATIHALIAWLAERHAEGGRVGSPPRWRIEENRWSAARHGVEGRMADLVSGARQPTRERLRRLLERLGPVSEDLGSADLLANARDLVEANGAVRQREVARAQGVERVARWAADQFLP